MKRKLVISHLTLPFTTYISAFLFLFINVFDCCCCCCCHQPNFAIFCLRFQLLQTLLQRNFQCLEINFGCMFYLFFYQNIKKPIDKICFFYCAIQSRKRHRRSLGPYFGWQIFITCFKIFCYSVLPIKP